MVHVYSESQRFLGGFLLRSSGPCCQGQGFVGDLIKGGFKGFRVSGLRYRV